MKLNNVIATWQSRGRWFLEIATRAFTPFRLARNTCAWCTLAPGASAGECRCDILILLIFLLTSCSPSTPQTTPEVVTVYSTSAAQPWLDPLYACGGITSVISRVDDPAAADIFLRVGEPEILAFPAFQIDTEEILIVTHRQSPVQNLTLEGARTLFTQTDPSLQVWVYAPGEDVQGVFDQVVMEGRNVTSSAFVALSPQQMSDTLVNQSNAIGILPRHWKAGNVRDVYSIATVPVLAITRNEPVGAIGLLIDCLQK